MKYLLDISFVGTQYAGYQIQKNAITIQKVLCDASRELFKIDCNITGCSRTDSGVHANSFMCTLEPNNGECNIPCSSLPFALNRILPSDISVKSCTTVDDDFHPRYGVKYKEYIYLIYDEAQRNPFFENRAYHCPKKLDIDIMNKAGEYFCGKHDFKAFMASGSDIIDTVRTVEYCKISRENALVKVTVAADGFLYNMVRIIVGTLISVSLGKIDAEELPRIITEGKRENAGFTAPAYGLYLNKVIY